LNSGFNAKFEIYMSGGVRKEERIAFPVLLTSYLNAVVVSNKNDCSTPFSMTTVFLQGEPSPSNGLLPIPPLTIPSSTKVIFEETFSPILFEKIEVSSSTLSASKEGTSEFSSNLLTAGGLKMIDISPPSIFRGFLEAVASSAAFFPRSPFMPYNHLNYTVLIKRL